MNGTEKFQRCIDEATQLSSKSRHAYKSALSTFLQGTSKITSESTELPMHGFWSLLIDCYDRYWRTVHELLANRNRDVSWITNSSPSLDAALQDRSELIAKLSPVNHNLDDLAHLKQHIMDCVKLCEDPMIYYNVREQNHYYGQLATAYSEYCGSRETFQDSLREANRLRASVSQTNKKLCTEGEKILKQCDRVMREVNWNLEDAISKHMIGVMDQLSRMVANLQNADTESVLSFEKEEFRREYLQSFSRKNLTRIINKEELAAVDTQTMIRAKSLIDEGIKRIKRSAELLNHYFSNSDEKLTYMRRSLIPIFRSVLGLKLSKNTKELCPSWKPLSMALKAAERVILGFMQFSSELMRQNAQALLNLRQQQKKLELACAHTTTLVDRPRRTDIRELLDFYYMIYKQLQTIAQIQTSYCNIFKQTAIKSLQKYSQNLNQVCSMLKMEDSMIRSPSSVNMYEYIRNELLSDILTQPIHWDKHFDNRVQNVLEHPFQFPTEQISAYGDGSYSCALGGKLLLAGRMKITDNIFTFESSFNKRNLFFGKTKLVIPKNQIMSVEKQTMVMLQNSIQILTKMGPLFFTSFFYRDQAFQQLEDLLYSAPDQDMNPRQQVESMKSQPLDPEQLKLISQRQTKVDNKLLNSLAHEILTIEYPELTLKAFYRIILSNAEARKGGKVYQNFRVLNLKQGGNSEIKCTNLQPLAPSYFDKSSDVKFSQAVPSQRKVTYKRKLPSLPIPFFPTHSNCNEVEKIHYVSTDKIVVEKENAAKGVPFSDTFYVKEKSVVTEVNGAVIAKLSFQIVFIEETSMKSILSSATEKEVKASANLFKDLSKKYIEQFKSRPKAKAFGQTVQTKIYATQQQISEVQESKFKSWQMKALLGGAAALLLLLILFFTIM